MSEDDTNKHNKNVIGHDRFQSRNDTVTHERQASEGNPKSQFLIAARSFFNDKQQFVDLLKKVVRNEIADPEMRLEASYHVGVSFYERGRFKSAKRFLLTPAREKYALSCAILGDIYRFERHYQNSLTYHARALESDSDEARRAAIFGLSELYADMQPLYAKCTKRHDLEENDANLIACFENVQTVMLNALRARNRMMKPNEGPQLPIK